LTDINNHKEANYGKRLVTKQEDHHC
jgi:hypothetical protein